MVQQTLINANAWKGVMTAFIESDLRVAFYLGNSEDTADGIYQMDILAARLNTELGPEGSL